VVPANCDIQIVGDGGYSVLNWNGNDFDPVMILQGPSKAILRDFRVRGGGQSKGKGIVIENADQKNSRIYMQEAFANLALQNGLLVDGLENARVDLRSFVHQNVYTNSDCASVKVVGGQNNLGGRTNIIAGAASGNILSYQASQGGVLAVKDVWYETTGTKPGYIKLTDNSTVTFELGRVFTTPTGVTPPSIDIQNYNGRATFIGLDLEDRINISGNGAGSILALGLMGHSPNYFFNNTGLNARLINSRWLNTTAGAPNAGTNVVNNIGSADMTFLRNMLTQTRGANLSYEYEAIPSGITDVRMYRVYAENTYIGFHIKK